MSSAKTVFTETDFAQFASAVAEGRSGVMLITERGEINKPRLIGSLTQFERLYGREFGDSLGHTIMRRLFARGAAVYVNRIGHYTDASDPSTLVPTKSSSTVQDRGSVFSTATLGTGPAGQVKYTSRIQGVAGDDITVEHDDPAGNDQPLTILVTGTDITVSLATGSGGAITSTAADIVAAINNHILASQLVFAEVVTAAVVAAVAQTPLADGGDSANTLTIEAHNEGAWSASGNLQFLISVSDADADRFNLQVIYTAQDDLGDTYRDLSMNPNDDRYAPTIINQRSVLIKVTDLATGTTPFGTRCPRSSPGGLAESFTVNGTGDSSDVVNADYIGDAAGKTGLNAFDGIDDIKRLAAITKDATADHDLWVAGAAYAANRLDLVYVQSVPRLSTGNAVDWRNRTGTYNSGTPVQSNYAALYFGHLLVSHPRKSQVEIPPVGDAIAAWHYTQNRNAYRAAAGLEMGVVPGVISIHENVGSSGRVAEADLLSDNEVNFLAAYGGEPTCVWDQRTATRMSSPLRDLHVRDLLIVMRKVLSKVNRIHLFRPHLPATWRLVYRLINSFMTELARRGAIEGGEGIGYQIFCDQFASTVEEAVLQTPEKREAGEMVVKIYFKPTGVIRYIGIEAIITSKSISFQELFNVNQLVG